MASQLGKRARTPAVMFREVCAELDIRPDKDDAFRLLELMLSRDSHDAGAGAPEERPADRTQRTQVDDDDDDDSTSSEGRSNSESSSSADSDPSAGTFTIYVLRLSDGKFYVGKTADGRLRLRVEEHMRDGGGSAWTRRYRPLDVLHSRSGCSRFEEDAETMKMMDRHGVDNVRGGKYVSPTLSAEQRDEIERSLRSANDRCFRCGGTHFANACPGGAVWKRGEHEQCIRCGGCHFLRRCHMTDYVELRPENVDCTRCGRYNHRHERCIAKEGYHGAALRD